MKLSDEKFKRRIGTTKAVFQTMLDILQAAYDELHQSGGKLPDLTVGDKLLITLKYYREYVTMESLTMWLKHRAVSIPYKLGRTDCVKSRCCS